MELTALDDALGFEEIRFRVDGGRENGNTAIMPADDMLLDENEPFDALMKRCAAIEAQANAPRSRNKG